MKLIAILVLCATIVGCDDQVVKKPSGDAGHGIIRSALNKQCLQLAADINKATSQTYNDLEEVVDACSTQSYYQANNICESNNCTIEFAKDIVSQL